MRPNSFFSWCRDPESNWGHVGFQTSSSPFYSILYPCQNVPKILVFSWTSSLCSLQMESGRSAPDLALREQFWGKHPHIPGPDLRKKGG